MYFLIILFLFEEYEQTRILFTFAGAFPLVNKSKGISLHFIHTTQLSLQLSGQGCKNRAQPFRTSLIYLARSGPKFAHTSCPVNELRD